MMVEDFNIKEGLTKALKTALKNDSFVAAVFDMLLGRKNAANEVEYELKSAAQENTLNEIVAVHRLYKQTLKEGVIGSVMEKPKELMRRIFEIRKKSTKFMRKVLIQTLKKPGMLASFIYIIKAILTPGYVLDDLLAAPQAVRFIKALIETAIEVANEDEEMQVALAEGITTNENSVNIMVGRFQPFTLGHLKCLRGIKNSLGVPTLLCVIPGNGDDKHPFMGSVQDEMYEKLKEANPDLIADVAYVKNAFLEAWVIAAKERGLEPVSWTCGNDRIDSYRSMVAKHGEKYGLNPDFQVYLVDRGDDNISATSVRESLLAGNKEKFMSEMPECLWDMYDEMRQVMVGETEPAYSQMNEDERYYRAKEKLNEAIEKMVERTKKDIL